MGQLHSPEKQAQLRDEALAKILLKSNRAGYALGQMRLGQEVLARDSKKTGYFPARLVVSRSGLPSIEAGHIRIHYDGRPEREYRDVPTAFVHYLPHHEDSACWTNIHILLSPWVLLDDMHNFEKTPLLAYAKVFERTWFSKIRLLGDGNFELVDRKGRIVKVVREWIHRHSTVHPHAIEEAVLEAQIHEQFLELTYGASHSKSFLAVLQDSKASWAESSREAWNEWYSTEKDPAEEDILCANKNNGPPVQYGNHSDANSVGESTQEQWWLPASFASAIHAFGVARQCPQLQACANSISAHGKHLKVDSKLRSNFVDLVNQIANPIGYRIEPLRFFDILDAQKQQLPVVASILPPNGFGRCVSFWGEWVFDSTMPYASQRTPEGLRQLYGEGEFAKAAAWSYCLVPIQWQPPSQSSLPSNKQLNTEPLAAPVEGMLFKKKSRRKRSRGGKQNNNHHHRHHQSMMAPALPACELRNDMPCKRPRWH